MEQTTVFNFDEVQESKFINEEGEQLLKIIKFDIKEVNDKLVHSFTCINKDKQQIKVDFFITENALWRYKMFISALGISASGTLDVSIVSPRLIDKKFIGYIKRKETTVNAVTGIETPSKYFEITTFNPSANA